MERSTASPYHVSVGSRVNTASSYSSRSTSQTVVFPLPSRPSSVMSILARFGPALKTSRVLQLGDCCGGERWRTHRGHPSGVKFQRPSTEWMVSDVPSDEAVTRLWTCTRLKFERVVATLNAPSDSPSSAHRGLTAPTTYRT